ncbi:sensor histidine kinase [Catenuloplanes atrovinosus]|uniref:histidine kinase n=1 Tax=Catenuloplanes atrovinosus TaxID=137266 RepID=A0AAE3YPG7_9ACTN|nr:sensor histidine kinase [Catenuloplanes atrovinosus]MDR7276802.1 signal transduction histidine kinase [Catenuloplanes atrovinosus]
MSTRRLPPLLEDAGLGVLTTAAVLIAIAVADEPGARPPDAGSAAIAVLLGVLLLGRRRWPLGVLLAGGVALMGYYVAEYPGIPPALPLAAALYSAAAFARLRWAALVAGGFLVLELLMRHHILGQPWLPALAATVTDGSLLMVVVLLGETIRSRRVRLAEAQERLVRAEAAREQEAARRVAEERLRIAREVHDVLGHTIAAITVQAGLADDVLDSRPDEARVALRAIRSTARQAMTELRTAVGLLRGPASLAPPPGLDGIAALAEVARAAGLEATVVTAGEPAPVPGPVALTAYRIIQEALTNTVRHAGAHRVRIDLRYAPGTLDVEVTDDGRGAGAAPPDGPGVGLRGMAERAAVVGGALSAGPRPGGGFRVHARLPVAGGEEAA